MRSQGSQQLMRIARHRYFQTGVAVLLVGVIFGVSAGLGEQEAQTGLSKPAAETSATSTVIGPYETEAVTPQRLLIPALGIDTTFGPSLGINPDQTIEVPDSFTRVGYYRFAPTPGEVGPAVVLGHVDSYEGPAVFYRLGELTGGDTIEIERTDGSVAVFVVTRLERHPQSGFPTAKVYRDLNYAGLRLITCSGTYDQATTEYSHNLIVFARLQAIKPAPTA